MDIDPAKQAEQLQQIFFDLSAAVDNFRLDNSDSVAAKKQQLKDQAQALLMRGQQCTADALSAIRERLQPHLAAILGRRRMPRKPWRR